MSKKRLSIQYETHVCTPLMLYRQRFLKGRHVYVHLGEHMQKAANLLFPPSDFKHDMNSIVALIGQATEWLSPGGLGYDSCEVQMIHIDLLLEVMYFGICSQLSPVKLRLLCSCLK